MTPIASVRSYYFRELVAECPNPERFTRDDWRALFRMATAKAILAHRRANTIFNHTTQTWEQRI